MGRGRQKAKQTKVARALKYHTASIDVTALQRELSSGEDAGYDDRYATASDEGGGNGDDDPYARYGDQDDDEASDYASQSRAR